MTKSLLVKSMESSTIENKMSKKLHNMGTTQTKPKTPQQNNPNNKNIKQKIGSANVSLKTKTTSIANMYVNKSAENNNRESSLKKNVEKLQEKGCVKHTIKVHHAHHTPVKMNSRAVADLKPRRKWSTADDITFKKWS